MRVQRRSLQAGARVEVPATICGPIWASTPLEQAAAVRGGKCEGTIVHSYRGCTRHGLRKSMGRTGQCWDNAGAESLWSTFKHEHYCRVHLSPKRNRLLPLTND